MAKPIILGVKGCARICEHGEVRNLHRAEDANSLVNAIETLSADRERQNSSGKWTRLRHAPLRSRQLSATTSSHPATPSKNVQSLSKEDQTQMTQITQMAILICASGICG